MNRSRAPFLARFVVLDGLGVGAVLLDDGLGGGWAADVLALALVIVGIALVVRMTAQYLDIVENPAPGEQPAESGGPTRWRERAARHPGGHAAD